MKKTPCVFERDPKGLVTPTVNPKCQWVLDGEGVATHKWDGTACLVRDGILYARFDGKHGKPTPEGFEPCDEAPDATTGHYPGWVAVETSTSPNYKWHRGVETSTLANATYELIGPKVNGNPEKVDEHVLRLHGDIAYPDAPRDYEGLREFLVHFKGEGLVFHHPDGRKAKIRRSDFGYPWGPAAENKAKRIAQREADRARSKAEQTQHEREGK